MNASSAVLDLPSAVRSYVAARLSHQNAALSLMGRLVSDTETPADAARWADGEKFAPDGIALTCRCELEDSTVRWVYRMPTSVDLERAERALQAAVAASDPDADLCRAAVAVLNDLKEPWQGYNPNNPAEEEHVYARARRHRDVFQRLQALAAGVD